MRSTSSIPSKNYIWHILFWSLAVLFVSGGIFIPRLLLKHNTASMENQVVPVSSEDYDLTDTLMARQASEALPCFDRVRLILGDWTGTMSEITNIEQEIAATDSYLSSYQAVLAAKEHVNQLYELGLYPETLNSNYNNWYSYDLALYKYTDTTFYTYTVYLWCVTFHKYDNTLTHKVYLTDDGTLMFACQLTEGNSSSSPVTYSELKRLCGNLEALQTFFKDTELSLLPSNEKEPLDREKLILPNQLFTTEQLHTSTQAIQTVNLSTKKGVEHLFFYQLYDSGYYGIGFQLNNETP